MPSALHSVDGTGWITGVTGPGSETYASNINYKAAGVPSSMVLGNGITENYTRNDRLQPTGNSAGNLLTLGMYPCDPGLTSCATGSTGSIWRETITISGVQNAVQEFRQDSLNRLVTAAEKIAP